MRRLPRVIGWWWGDAFYSSTKNKFQVNEDEEAGTDRIYELRINPNVGYFFIDKLAGGLQANIIFTEFNASNGRGLKNHGYGLSPFMRYYFLGEERQINVFAQANYSLNFGGSFRENTTFNASGYGLQAGTALFFNQSVALELSLKYTSITQKASDNITNRLLVGFGLQIHLEKN